MLDTVFASHNASTPQPLAFSESDCHILRNRLVRSIASNIVYDAPWIENGLKLAAIPCLVRLFLRFQQNCIVFILVMSTSPMNTLGDRFLFDLRSYIYRRTGDIRRKVLKWFFKGEIEVYCVFINTRWCPFARTEWRRFELNPFYGTQVLRLDLISSLKRKLTFRTTILYVCKLAKTSSNRLDLQPWDFIVAPNCKMWDTNTIYLHYNRCCSMQSTAQPSM